MFETTPIEDLLIFRPRRHGDARGFFSETWSRDAFAAHGQHFDWCQDNHSLGPGRYSCLTLNNYLKNNEKSERFFPTQPAICWSV